MKLPGKRRKRGLALAMTLFFVLIAFFAASTLLVRSHYEAQATIMDTSAIQREALARSALASGLAMLESAGTDETFSTFSLAGEGAMVARVWLEQESDDLFRLNAEVKGGMGRPYVAQKVLRKKPRLSAIDMAHLLDGDLGTPDQLKYRVVGSSDWVSLPSSKSSMMWVEIDRRGNVTTNYFPILETGVSPNLPDGFIERLVARNDELINEGKIEHGFFKKASLAIEENWELNVNNAIDLGVNAGNYSGGLGQSAGNGGLNQTRLETDPDFIRPARVVTDALTKGAAIEHYSQDQGAWSTVELDLSREPSGSIPGPATSDGEGLYIPVIKPGADLIKRYDLADETWSEVPAPPAFVGEGQTQHLLDVEVDDDGRVYAHHGDEGQYGLSFYDPVTESWERLPSPPGLYLDREGRETKLTDTPSDWGNLTVDDQGNVFVIWRSKNSTEVFNHLAENSTGLPGPGSRPIGIGKTPDGIELPGQGFKKPPPDSAYGNTFKGGGFSSYGGSTPGGGVGSPKQAGAKTINAQVINSALENLATKPVDNPGNGNAGSAANAGFAPNAGFIGNAGNAGNIGVGSGPISGFTGFTGFTGFGSEIPQDMILKLSDGKWTVMRPPLNPGQSLGGIAAGIDGRLLLQVTTPTEDLLIGMKGDGTLEQPALVPAEDGTSAQYFGVDSGARKVPGKYTFQETADF